MITILISACTGLGGLTRHQVKVLKEQGFVYTDQGWILEMPSRLLFATNQFTFSEETAQTIAKLSKQLHSLGIKKLIIQGHTDNVGSEEYNQELSLKRANSVAEVTFKHGFNPNDVKTIGYGSTKPVVSNDTEEGRSENRRVAVIIVP